MANKHKKSALSNPRAADPDTQKFLNEMRTEMIRVSGMAVEALNGLANLPKAAAAAPVAAVVASMIGSGLLKQSGFWNFHETGKHGPEIRWGRMQLTNGGQVKVDFAEKFTNECFVVFAGGTNTTAANAQDNPVDVYTVIEPNTSGFTATCARSSTTVGHYIAVGY